jgi:hypothetical protein
MVRAVQHGAHTQEESRTKRKSSGPVFTLPALPCADTAPAATAVGVIAPATATATTTVPGKFGQASVPAPGVSAGELTRFVGRSTGSGQCVALAKAVQPNLGSTSHWRGGETVQGNTSLQPGTVIATFNKANRYANALDGSSHAAVYLGQDAKGVQVLDQWAGSRAAVRTIPWHNPGAVAANTGAAFQVVKSG